MSQNPYQKFTPANAKLLYQEVSASIFRAILDGNLSPGDRLVEDAIAKEVGVSRSPVRQAIQEMVRQGIAVMVPRKGAYVANWGINDVADFARVRIQLEGLATEQAAERIKPAEIETLYDIVEQMCVAAEKQAVDREIEADMAFHRQVVSASRNNTLISIYSAIELRTNMYMVYEKYISPSLGERVELTKQHKPIIDALDEGDGRKAKYLIEENVGRALDALLQRMRNIPVEVDGEAIPAVLGRLFPGDVDKNV